SDSNTASVKVQWDAGQIEEANAAAQNEGTVSIEGIVMADTALKAKAIIRFIQPRTELMPTNIALTSKGATPISYISATGLENAIEWTKTSSKAPTAFDGIIKYGDATDEWNNYAGSTDNPIGIG